MSTYQGLTPSALVQGGALASVSEIQTPFKISPSSGSVQTMSDPVQRAIQHILSLCFTAPGERVMNPEYGVGIQHLVFEDADPLEFQAVAMQVQAQLQVTDGLYYNVQVSVQSSPSQSGMYVFSVSFQVYGDSQIHNTIFDYTGSVIGAS